MDNSIFEQVIDVILNTVGGDIKREMLTKDFPLVGNILDSMAITNLILALEETFGFMFSDDELSAEAFENAERLTELIRSKVAQ